MINELIDTFMSLASMIADIHMQRKHSDAEASIAHQAESRQSRTRVNTFSSFAKGAWWCTRWFGIIDRPMNFHWLCVYAKLMSDEMSIADTLPRQKLHKNADSYRHLNDTTTQKGNQCHPNQFVCKQTHTTCTLCRFGVHVKQLQKAKNKRWKGGVLAKLMKWVTDIKHQSFVNCSERSQSAENQCRTEIQLFKTRMHAKIERKVFCCIADVHKNK